MAVLFAMNRGPSTNLAAQVFHDGYVYYTTDTHRLYVDCKLSTDNSTEEGGSAIIGTNRFQVEVDNAANANRAAIATSLSAGKGSVSKPVYFDESGLPQLCTSIDLKASTAGTADQAKKLVNGSTPYKVGDDGKTIVYFTGGVPTKSAATVGDANTPVYLSNGVLTACGSLDATSTAAQKLVKITDGVESDYQAGGATVPVYFSNGVPVACTSISLKAATAGAADTATSATTATKLSTDTAGDAETPVYFTGGKPVACTSLDLNTTGSAAKLSAEDKGSASVPVYFDGGVPKACTSISLKASTAGTADTAKKLSNTTAIGSTNKPVYFTNGGVPAECGTSLSVDISGTAATATSADKLSTDAGGATVPVYFSNGIPVACTSISLKASTAGTADVAKKLNNTSAIGSSTKPVYFTSSGVPSECGDTLGVNISGKANTAGTADKLGTNAGGTSVPVYFDAGIPKACNMQFALANGSTVAQSNLEATDSTTKIPSTAWVQSAINNKMSAANAMTFKGTIALTSGKGDKIGVPTTQNAGDTYMVNEAGSYAGATAEVGDLLVAVKDRASAGNSITNSEWTVVQTNINGAITTTATNGVGGATVPVYINEQRKAIACTSLSLNTTGSAAKLSNTTAIGSSKKPVYFTNGGVPSACGDTLDVSISGKAATAGAADTAASATTANKLSTDAGGATVPVYFSNGIPVACTSLSLNTSGSAAKLNNTTAIGSSKKPVYFTSGGVPTACGSSLDVDISGKAATAGAADTATSATTASKLSTDAGGATVPVYFSNGVPVACTSISLKASTAGTADVAKKLNNTTAIGSSTKPVYFTSSGVPSECGTSLAVDITGNAATATSAGKLSAADKGSASVPVYFDGGVPKACTSISLKAATAGAADTATTASKLSNTTAVGSTTKPVYFTANGVPAPCNDTLGVSISGTAATATKLGSDGGSVSLPVYFTGGKPSPITSLDVGSGAIKTTGKITGGTIEGNLVYGAVWNDYAEFREGTTKVEPGRIVYEVGDDTVALTERRMMPAVSAVSDTFGFAIGETEYAKTPLAVAGRVLVYTDEDRNNFKAGDVVCSGPNGTVSKMTREEIREYPECILGIVSAIPSYKTWGQANVEVNGRIWVTIK